MRMAPFIVREIRVCPSGVRTIARGNKFNSRDSRLKRRISFPVATLITAVTNSCGFPSWVSTPPLTAMVCPSPETVMAYIQILLVSISRQILPVSASQICTARADMVADRIDLPSGENASPTHDVPAFVRNRADPNRSTAPAGNGSAS